MRGTETNRIRIGPEQPRKITVALPYWEAGIIHRGVYTTLCRIQTNYMTFGLADFINVFWEIDYAK